MKPILVENGLGKILILTVNGQGEIVYKDLKGNIYDGNCDSIKPICCATDDVDGKSAYEIAIENGFMGTEQEWLNSLKGENGSAGFTPQPIFTGTQLSWDLTGDGTADTTPVDLKGDPGTGSTFQCSDLNSCSIEDLSDVDAALLAQWAQDTDTNNYVENIGVVDNGDGTKTITLTRAGLPNLEATFTDNTASGGTGDNWGTQVVQSDTTLNGDGTVSNPLKVDATQLSYTDLQNKPVIPTNTDSFVTGYEITNNGVDDVLRITRGGNTPAEFDVLISDLVNILNTNGMPLTDDNTVNTNFTLELQGAGTTDDVLRITDSQGGSVDLNLDTLVSYLTSQGFCQNCYSQGSEINTPTTAYNIINIDMQNKNKFVYSLRDDQGAMSGVTDINVTGDVDGATLVLHLPVPLDTSSLEQYNFSGYFKDGLLSPLNSTGLNEFFIIGEPYLQLRNKYLTFVFDVVETVEAEGLSEDTYTANGNTLILRNFDYEIKPQ